MLQKSQIRRWWNTAWTLRSILSLFLFLYLSTYIYEVYINTIKYNAFNKISFKIDKNEVKNKIM